MKKFLIFLGALVLILFLSVTFLPIRAGADLGDFNDYDSDSDSDSGWDSSDSDWDSSDSDWDSSDSDWDSDSDSDWGSSDSDVGSSDSGGGSGRSSGESDSDAEGILGIVVIVCIIGYIIFNKLQRKFAEEL